MAQVNKKLIENILFENEKAEAFIDKNDYGNAAKLLLEFQKESWEKLASGYKSLDSLQIKEFDFNNFKIKVQFNPGRIISSSAKVDSKSINNRTCFLCYENLPAEQKGILYKHEYLILCYPYPIFPEHFTLSNINHFPQSIKESFDMLLTFSKDLSQFYSVFYNGPKCGASAPDHLHFQAGNNYFIPIDDEFEFLKDKYGEILIKNDKLTVRGIDDGLRRYISLEGNSKKAIINSFNIFFDIYYSIANNGEEPMMNILSSYQQESGWRIIIFLRNKHRSSHYFEEGYKNILISPAAVDIGGVCITPLEKDFKKITKELLQEIFQEIIIGKEHFDFIKSSLTKKLIIR